MEHFNVDFTFFSVNLRSDYPHYNKLAERLSYIWCRNIYYIFMSIFNDLQLTAVIQKRIKKPGSYHVIGFDCVAFLALSFLILHS